MQQLPIVLHKLWGTAQSALLSCRERNRLLSWWSWLTADLPHRSLPGPRKEKSRFLLSFQAKEFRRLPPKPTGLRGLWTSIRSRTLDTAPDFKKPSWTVRSFSPRLLSLPFNRMWESLLHPLAARHGLILLHKIFVLKILFLRESHQGKKLLAVPTSPSHTCLTYF